MESLFKSFENLVSLTIFSGRKMSSDQLSKIFEHFAADGGYTYLSCLEKENSFKTRSEFQRKSKDLQYG